MELFVKFYHEKSYILSLLAKYCLIGKCSDTLLRGYPACEEWTDNPSKPLIICSRLLAFVLIHQPKLPFTSGRITAANSKETHKFHDLRTVSKDTKDQIAGDSSPPASTVDQLSINVLLYKQSLRFGNPSAIPVQCRLPGLIDHQAVPHHQVKLQCAGPCLVRSAMEE